jgi:hypothetical protein
MLVRLVREAGDLRGELGALGGAEVLHLVVASVARRALLRGEAALSAGAAGRAAAGAARAPGLVRVRRPRVLRLALLAAEAALTEAAGRAHVVVILALVELLDAVGAERALGVPARAAVAKLADARHAAVAALAFREVRCRLLRPTIAADEAKTAGRLLVRAPLVAEEGFVRLRT